MRALFLTTFHSISSSIVALGYVGIWIALLIEGLGLPFPGDAFLAFYGFSAAKGKMNLTGVIFISVLGYLFGTSLAYIASHNWGMNLTRKLNQWGILQNEHMERTVEFIEKYGAILLVPGRFLPGIRSLSSYAAGLCRMDFRWFLLYTGIGACLWCSLWILCGYWLGENLKYIMQSVQSTILYISGGIALLLIAYWSFRRLRSHRT